MAEKVTTMVLKVDLDCCKCYKKVKKVLSKFPQIRDQVYDEKQNTVTIKVACCCDPEKLRDKICRKGGGTIKSIEIKPPEKPKGPEKKKEPEKPKESEKKKEPEKPKEPEKKKEPEKPKEKPADPKPDKPKVTFVDPPKSPPKAPVPTATGYPPPTAWPFGPCCTECYQGHGGGPCTYGGGPPRYYYDGYYGRPVYDSWGCGGSRRYYGRRSDCFSEENPSACTIM